MAERQKGCIQFSFDPYFKYLIYFKQAYMECSYLKQTKLTTTVEAAVGGKKLFGGQNVYDTK
jgi:hypothetical protein